MKDARVRTVACILAAAIVVLAQVTVGAGSSDAAQDNRPLDGIIAFIRDGDIWTIATDGSDERQVTSGGDYTEAAWSPDGATIAYVQEVTGGQDDTIAWQIGLLDIGSLEEEVVAAPEQIHVSLPGMYYNFRELQWSPDGQSLFIIAGDGRVQGQNLRQINLSDRSINEQQLAFTHSLAVSPAEQRIAYTTFYNAVPSGHSLTVSGADLMVRDEILPIVDGRSVSDVCWTGDGLSLIVASSQADGTGNISRLAPDGSNQEAIRDDVQVRNLACSPVDDSFVYQTGDSLWLYEAGTGRARALTSGSQPSWGVTQETPGAAQAAQETLLAYYDTDGGIHLIRGDGTGDILVTDSGQPTFNIADMELKWSPDGRQLAFVRWEYEGRSQVESLVVYDLADAKLEAIVTDNNISGFDWWPDSASIVYSPPYPGGWILGQQPSSSVPGLQILALDSGESREIVPAERDKPLIRPQVSYDGKYIAVQEAELEGHGVLVVYDVEAQHYPNAYQVLGNIDWAPDANLIAYDGVPYVPVPGSQIHIVDARGAKSFYLTPAREDSGDMSPRFSPTGEQVAFLRVDVRSGNQGLSLKTLWLVPAGALYGDGSSERQLTTFNVNEFSWAPDGRRLAAGSGDYPGEAIYIIDSARESREWVAAGYGPAWQPAAFQALAQPESAGAREEATATSVTPPTATATPEDKSTAVPNTPTPTKVAQAGDAEATNTPAGSSAEEPEATSAPDEATRVAIPVVAAGDETFDNGAATSNRPIIVAIVALGGLGVVLGIVAVVWYRRGTARAPLQSEASSCPQCGAARPPGARYCPQCGADFTGGRMD